MGVTEEIIKMAKKNNGTVTTAMVVAAGFSRGNIKYLGSFLSLLIYF
ncbi:MAG: type IV toxin-antitoxin system AbiEi family antitoxin domain-containing protein [Butyrivibrio sp.]|nr:type IV toxin-antitoxin system AbiEi family antitoxin domain-containing protein [Acetatifactor muris]MCM1559958.1 type IV toxin-antitoxin system AbiEi family antitoxin domain-containing protein [Butyrivibrio sp.]